MNNLLANKTETKTHGDPRFNEGQDDRKESKEDTDPTGSNHIQRAVLSTESLTCFTTFIKNSTLVMQNILSFVSITLKIVVQHEMAGHLTSEMLAQQIDLSQKKIRRKSHRSTRKKVIHPASIPRHPGIRQRDPTFLVIQTSNRYTDFRQLDPTTKSPRSVPFQLSSNQESTASMFQS